MIIEKLSNGIVYVKNILPKNNVLIEKIEELESLMSNSNQDYKTTKWDRWDYGDQHFCMKKRVPRPEDLDVNEPLYQEQLFISKTITDAVNNAMSEYFNIYPYAKIESKSLERSISLLKYEKGGYLPEHSDLGISTRVISGVVYLNDNYVGGEINFPYADLKIKPEAGSCVIFPSSYLGAHSVSELKEGVRYVLPYWFHHVFLDNQVMSDGTA
jgi:Rps23 Pro-64 3,4-dihydroxylase Tpa1-like proline 4-hydroxylase